MYQISYISGKDIKDIFHNMQEFKQTGNDGVYQMFENIMENEKIFHKEFEVLIHSNVNGELMEDLILQNENNYTYIKAHAFKLYTKYMDIDLAILLNTTDRFFFTQQIYN